jgi:hypothetical protein
MPFGHSGDQCVSQVPDLRRWYQQWCQYVAAVLVLNDEGYFYGFAETSGL